MSDPAPVRWFGPKTLGWGWSPTTPQGWVVMGVFLLTFWLSYVVLGRSLVGKIVRLKVLGLLFMVILMTGGKPGSKLFGRPSPA